MTVAKHEQFTTVNAIFREFLGVTPTKVIGPICCILLVAMIGAAQPQSVRRNPKEIAQIVDASLQGVIPSDSRLSGVTVGERGLRFDFRRTMGAFGYDVDDSTARSSLQLHTVVTPGTQALISDCNQVGTKPCKILGKAAYVYVVPVLVTDSEAEVTVHVTWATWSAERAYLSGFAMRAHLSRVGARPWKFGHVSGAMVY